MGATVWTGGFECQRRSGELAAAARRRGRPALRLGEGRSARDCSGRCTAYELRAQPSGPAVMLPKQRPNPAEVLRRETGLTCDRGHGAGLAADRAPVRAT